MAECQQIRDLLSAKLGELDTRLTELHLRLKNAAGRSMVTCAYLLTEPGSCCGWS